MIPNPCFTGEKDHEPDEQGISYFDFLDWSREISLLSHEPHELLLWKP
jgi:hypothetical protein